jgi:hypothetical protein
MLNQQGSKIACRFSAEADIDGLPHGFAKGQAWL